MAKEFKNVELPWMMEIPAPGLKDGSDIVIKGEMKNIAANTGFAIALGTTKTINLSSPTGVIPLIFEVDYMKKEVLLKVLDPKNHPRGCTCGCEVDIVGLTILKKDSLTKWLPLQKNSDCFQIILRATESCLQVWIDGVPGMFAAITHLACPLDRVAWLHISDAKSGGALKVPSVIFKKVTPLPTAFPATEGGITSATRTPVPSV